MIGVFGGTFDPIHYGHLKTALALVRLRGFSRVIFVPTATPPHKPGARATGEQRLEMLKLAVRGQPSLDVSDVELHRSGPSYTIDTIEHFKGELDAEGRIYFILGIDAFLEINTWKSFRSLLAQSAVIVMSRPQAGSDADDLASTVAAFAQQRICSDYQWDRSRSALVHPRYQTIHLARIKPVDIASSRIRRMIREGRDIAQWIPPAVAHYIDQKDLYR